MISSAIKFLNRKSIKSVGIYTLAGFWNKAISFIALLFFINILSEGDMGILNIFSTSIAFLTPVISMGSFYTITVDYFKMPKKEYSTLFTSSLIIPGILVLVLPIPLYIFSGPLSRTFEYQKEFFWLIPTCLLLNYCFEIFQRLLIIEKKIRKVAQITIIRTFSEVLFSLLFIYLIYTTWYGRAIGYALSLLIMGLIFFHYVIKNKFLVRQFSLLHIKKELLFGIAGLTLQMGIFFLTSSDKFFIMANYGKTNAGFYSVASTFATIQIIVSIALLGYLQPILYQSFTEGKNWHHMKSTFLKYISVMIIFLVALYIGTTIVYSYFLKESYRSYVHIFYLLALSTFIWSMSNIFLQIIIFKKNKKLIGLLSFIIIVIAFNINFFTSKYLGISWVCYGQILINLIVFLTILLFSRKLGFFQWKQPPLPVTAEISSLK
ncbi:MAG: oligosaccharide flippase family protein [Chitinophagaceae bacterium]|nr:oligosaccharide flippase family protein [Chitinophagaceae bacterium]